MSSGIQCNHHLWKVPTMFWNTYYCTEKKFRKYHIGREVVKIFSQEIYFLKDDRKCPIRWNEVSEMNQSVSSPCFLLNPAALQIKKMKISENWTHFDHLIRNSANKSKKVFSQSLLNVQEWFLLIKLMFVNFVIL